MTLDAPDTDQLLNEVAAGNESAAPALLARHRRRLSRLVAVRLDPRISARIDPSDVVQEALAEAFQRLPRYVKERPVSFYPWLRQIAWQRLVKLHRAHIGAQRRSVRREAADLELPDESAVALAERLATSASDVRQRLAHEEMRGRVRKALDQLRSSDRELLVMRYLEHMSLKEIGDTLHITAAAAKTRHARALLRLQQLLSDDS